MVNKKSSLKKLIEKKQKTRTHSIKFDRVKIIYFQFIIFFLRYVRLLKAYFFKFLVSPTLLSTVLLTIFYVSTILQ